MCVNCISQSEVVLLNAGGFMVAASAGLSRVRDALVGRTSLQRRRDTWDANADFLASLGHSPEDLLGARPGEPVPVLVG